MRRTADRRDDGRVLGDGEARVTRRSMTIVVGSHVKHARGVGSSLRSAGQKQRTSLDLSQRRGRVVLRRVDWFFDGCRFVLCIRDERHASFVVAVGAVFAEDTGPRPWIPFRLRVSCGWWSPFARREAAEVRRPFSFVSSCPPHASSTSSSTLLHGAIRPGACPWRPTSSLGGTLGGSCSSTWVGGETPPSRGGPPLRFPFGSPPLGWERTHPSFGFRSWMDEDDPSGPCPLSPRAMGGFLSVQGRCSPCLAEDLPWIDSFPPPLGSD